eukprot:scaffold394396_cov51-Prasinocladus_malaysianus.AAC.1
MPNTLGNHTDLIAKSRTNDIHSCVINSSPYNIRCPEVPSRARKYAQAGLAHNRIDVSVPPAAPTLEMFGSISIQQAVQPIPA